MTPRYEASIKAQKWLKFQGLKFREINLEKSNPQLREQLFQIIQLLEGDVFGLISTRSRRYRILEEKINQLSLSQLVELLVSNPQLLRQPIISDGYKLQIGYNPDEIRVFIPKGMRKMKLKLIEDKILSES